MIACRLILRVLEWGLILYLVLGMAYHRIIQNGWTCLMGSDYPTFDLRSPSIRGTICLVSAFIPIWRVLFIILVVCLSIFEKR